MIKSIFLLIEQSYPTQSKAFRKISDYIRDNYTRCQYLSISEMSSQIGVSTGSIYRYCRSLGYDGYPALIKELQRVSQLEMAPMREIRNSITNQIDDGDVLRDIIESNIENLRMTYTEALDEEYRRAVERIHSARRIYVIGLRSAFAVAYYLYFMLSDFLDNVTLLSVGTEDLYDRILQADENDVLIAIGFERYTRKTCEVASFLSERGVHVIALTDTPSSPLSVAAEITLLAKNSSTTFSYASAMTILNALVVGVGRYNRERTLEALERKKELLAAKGVHYAK